MKTLLGHFARMVAQNHIEIYNEFSLQHEFGIFIRNAQRDAKVQFERNVSYFFNQTNHFLKKEIDLAVFAPDKTALHYVIEFKYPRNGQYPEQMYSFCKDIAFLEQLKTAGFTKAFFVAFADDRLFYEGNGDGIYGFFRKQQQLRGEIRKPTGNQGDSVTIAGTYTINWKPINGNLKYVVVEI